MADDNAILSGGFDGLMQGAPMGVAQTLLANNLNPQCLRVNNSPLKENEWKLVTDSVVRATTARLSVVNDFVSRGLVRILDNPLGVGTIAWHKASDVSDAKTTIEGIAATDKDVFTQTEVQVPNVLTHKDFQLSIRLINESRRMGTQLDQSMPELAARKVGEQLETLLVSGGGVYGGNTVYGLLNAPSKNTTTFKSNVAWDNGSKTGADILFDFLAMVTQLDNDGYPGPYGLYTTRSYYNALQNDFSSAKGSDTIAQRLLRDERLATIKASDKITANYAILVQLTRDVVEIAVGDLGGQRVLNPDMPPAPITVVTWDGAGGMIMNFKVISDLVPMAKCTGDGDSGICVSTV
jgi:uncharacterized linocin/CFP29 family protein